MVILVCADKDVLANCPGVGRTSVFNALKKLNEEGFIDKHGEGKGSFSIAFHDY